MSRGFRLLPEPSTHVLVPFDRREVMGVKAAADLAGYSEAHTRRLVGEYELGRHIGRGMWKVSRVAWRLFLDGDAAGLRAYHEGRRDHPSVRAEFERIGIAVVITTQTAEAVPERPLALVSAVQKQIR